MKNSFYKILIATVFICMFLGLLIKPTIREINYGLDFKGGFEVLYKVEPLKKNGELTSDMLKNTYKAIVNRIDTLGVSEPEIVIEGENIRVRLPGVTDEEEARNRLSTPAVLSFRNTSDEELMNASVLGSPGAKLDFDTKTNKPVVALNINDNKTFYDVTKEISSSSDKTIVIWLDFEEGDSFENEKDKCGKDGNLKCISAATVEEAFMNNVVIQGNFTEEEAQNLVYLINSGSLPTKLLEISTKSVDASLGNSTITSVFISFIISLIVISLILIFKYRFYGFISSICLFIYTLLVFIIFNKIGGVLTLPGIAAMILGIGMAVDSTVISNERIKDELRENANFKVAVAYGNKSSLVAIVDANVTTLLVSVILFIFGESSVKGFATMLIITIILTVLVMVYLNRFIINLFIKTGFFDKKVNCFLGKINKTPKFDFMKNSKYFIFISLFTIIVGSGFLLINGINLGVDFKGGTLIEIKNSNEKEVVDVVNNYTVIEKNIGEDTSSYKIKETLVKDDINKIKNELKEYAPKITTISNIVKKNLTKNAIISLLISFIGMILYIAIRFNFNFGISSIIALLHDILIVISIFIMFRIEVNFIFVAAILTIIGYSINDTIVVFDKIRENKKKLFKNNIKTNEELKKLINISTNETVFRNIWTTITTISTLIILMCMGINGLKEFNLALLIGLIAGSVSSIVIVPAIYYFFEKNSIKNIGKKKIYEDELDEKEIKGINS